MIGGYDVYIKKTCEYGVMRKIWKYSEAKKGGQRVRTRGGLTFILVALLLVSSVTTANAVSQSWYLTDDSTGVPAGADYFMDKGSGTGTGDVPIGMLWICGWVHQMNQQQ